jgi:hypothetical protein
MTKKLKIGYLPNSDTLNAPGDRRRFIFWGNKRNVEIVLNEIDRCDVIVSTSRHLVSIAHKIPKNKPFIIDLPDFLVGENRLLWDYSRTFAHTKSLSNLTFKRFSQFIMNLIDDRTSIICSSPEQRIYFESKKIFVSDILDSHEEFDEIPFSYEKYSDFQTNIFWEGQAGSIPSLIRILDNIQESSINFNLVTDANFYLFANRFFEIQTEDFLSRKFGEKSFVLHSWRTDNVVQQALASHIFVIPTLDKSFSHLMKPENRALISWRLGLPVILSNSPAHLRLSKHIQTPILVEHFPNWEGAISFLKKNPDVGFEQVKEGKDYLSMYHNSEILLKKWDNHFAKLGILL